MSDKYNQVPRRSIFELLQQRRVELGQSGAGRIASAANVRLLPPTPPNPEHVARLSILSELVAQTLDVFDKRRVSANLFALGEIVRQPTIIRKAEYERIPLWTLRSGQAPPPARVVSEEPSRSRPNAPLTSASYAGVGLGTEGTLYKISSASDMSRLGRPILVAATVISDRELLASPGMLHSEGGGSSPMRDEQLWEKTWANILVDGIMLHSRR